MISDIKMEDQNLVLQGDLVDVQASAIALDGITNREESFDSDLLRRALVHDAADSLTINWRNKYTGGVTIFGNVSTPDNLSVGTLSLKIPAAPPSPVETPIGKVTAPADTGMQTQWRDPFQHLSSAQSPIDLAAEIKTLRECIQNLNERLKVLEA